MSTYTTLVARFPNNKKAQDFSYWLYREGYEEKSLSESMVAVHLRSYGDHFCATEWARDHEGTILRDHIEDDS